MKFKKIAQIFVLVMLFSNLGLGSLFDIKAMDLNQISIKGLSSDVIREIKSLDDSSIYDITQEEIDQIKALIKDESSENKLNKLNKFLEILKNFTFDYLDIFLDNPEDLVNEAMELDTEFSKLYIKQLINPEFEMFNTKTAEKINQNFINLKKNQLKKASFLIEAGIDLNFQDEFGDTALIWAVRKSCRKDNPSDSMVKLLIETGVDLNLQNKSGYSALMLASISHCKEMVTLLVEAGVDLNIQDNFGYTALMLASMRGWKEIVEILIKSGARLNLQNKDGDTALILATNDSCKMVRFLIAAGVDPNIQNKDGDTALDKASFKGYRSIVRFLEKILNY